VRVSEYVLFQFATSIFAIQIYSFIYLSSLYPFIHCFFFSLFITENQRMQFAPKGTTYSVSDEEVKLHPCDNTNHSTLDNMIAEYQMFHDRWMEGLKKFRDKEMAADPAPNGNTEMVAV